MQAWVTPAESSSIASDDYGLTGALTASAAGKGPPTGRGGRVRSLRQNPNLRSVSGSSESGEAAVVVGWRVTLWSYHPPTPPVQVTLWSCHPPTPPVQVTLWSCHPPTPPVQVTLWSCHPPHPASAGDAVELPPPHPASAGDAVELPPPHPASAGDAVELPPPHPASAGDAVELPPPHPASAVQVTPWASLVSRLCMFRRAVSFVLTRKLPGSTSSTMPFPMPRILRPCTLMSRQGGKWMGVRWARSEAEMRARGRHGRADLGSRSCGLIKREEGKSQQFECKYCPLVFSGAAIRCAQHLTSWKNMKRREVSLCKNAPHDVRVEMKSMYEKKAADAEERRRSSEAAIASVLPSGKRSRITDYLDGDAAGKKRDAHQSLALMFAGCHIAEHIVDHPLFVNAMRDVARAGDGYVPPGRKYIGGTGLQACRRGIESGLVGIKASWKKIGVTVASDMMTDRAGRPQANVFLVNDAAAVLHMCVDCNMEKKTGGYIAGLLRPVVEEVVPCATHVLDLLMEDVGKLGWAKRVVKRTGEMTSFVRNHHWTRGYLRTPELVEGSVMQTLKPAGTRFGTQYISVSRLCALRNSLTQMVLSDLWKAWAAGDADRQKAADGFAALVLDAAWWKSAEFFVKLMKLPFMAMRQTDGEAKGMMGRLYDVMLQLTEDVEAIVEADEEHLSSTDKQAIRKILKDRWDGSLACAMHVAGRILNPANQEEDIFGGDVECTRVEPPIPVGYKIAEEMEEEEGEDDVLADEYQ
ncbi:unnamed protein product [Closterium sp. NIES-64]|nr:unnamed protein product [Closterium sp. NIES-64]